MTLGKILVVGGTGGIGGPLARRLAKKGFQLHLIARQEDKLKALSQEISAAYSVVDAKDTKALEQAVAAAGPLQGLAYCVGSIPLKPLKAASPDDFLDAFKLNTLGAVVSVKAALGGMTNEFKKTKVSPSVLLFSTVAVKQGFTNHSIISTAKGGIEALTLALAAELSPTIRVNCLAPSLTDTPLAVKLTSSNAMREAIAKAHPIPRLGTGEDMAGLGALLLDPQESSWITGQVFAVDGGRSTLKK